MIVERPAIRRAWFRLRLLRKRGGTQDQ